MVTDWYHNFMTWMDANYMFEHNYHTSRSMIHPVHTMRYDDTMILPKYWCIIW